MTMDKQRVQDLALLLEKPGPKPLCDIQSARADLRDISQRTNDHETTATISALLQKIQIDSVDELVGSMNQWDRAMGVELLVEYSARIYSACGDQATTTRIIDGYGYHLFLATLLKFQGVEYVKMRLNLWHVLAAMKEAKPLPENCMASIRDACRLELDISCFLIALQVFSTMSRHCVLDGLFDLLSVPDLPKVAVVASLLAKLASGASQSLEFISHPQCHSSLASLHSRDKSMFSNIVAIVLKSVETDSEATGKVCSYLDASGSESCSLVWLAWMACLFMTHPKLASPIFLKHIPAYFITLRDKSDIELANATLGLLAEACVDLESRQFISSKQELLASLLADPNVCARALLVLVKLGPLSQEMQLEFGSNLGIFEALLEISESEATGVCLQALSFLTLDSAIAEKITTTPVLWRTLIDGKFPSKENISLSIILYNITAYPKELTSDEQQLLILRGMENQKKVSAEDIKKEFAEKSQAVKIRIQRICSREFVQLICMLGDSVGILERIGKTLAGIARDPQLRGLLVQAGAVKKLLQVANVGSRDAQTALARITISVDPFLSFPGERRFELVRPLLNLLQSDYGLDQFESLTGLTNLASMDSAMRHKIGVCVDQCTMLQFSSIMLVRRASTELICNLLMEPEVCQKFSAQSTSMLVALCGDDDLNTQLAASGALCMLRQAGMPLTESLKHVGTQLQTSAHAGLVARGRAILETQ